jgi:hypothetical protein
MLLPGGHRSRIMGKIYHVWRDFSFHKTYFLKARSVMITSQISPSKMSVVMGKVKTLSARIHKDSAMCEKAVELKYKQTKTQNPLSVVDGDLALLNDNIRFVSPLHFVFPPFCLLLATNNQKTYSYTTPSTCNSRTILLQYLWKKITPCCYFINCKGSF